MLRDKSFVQGGRGDGFKSVGPYKIEVKNLKEGGGEVSVLGGRIFSMEACSEVGQEAEEAEANPVGKVSSRPASSS